VLDPNEKLVFDGLVSRLRDEDPSFLRKLERIGRPRRNRRIVFGGWTGLLMAVVAISYGALLVTKRDDRSGHPAWRSSSHRHPGAPL
jgi:Protein of unknown function (DUF3040)